jgi:hypothetical protein
MTIRRLNDTTNDYVHGHAGGWVHRTCPSLSFIAALFGLVYHSEEQSEVFLDHLEPLTEEEQKKVNNARLSPAKSLLKSVGNVLKFLVKD